MVVLSPLETRDLSSRVLDKLTLQRYGEGKTISGVQLIDFSLYTDDGGDFHEIARLTSGVVERIPGFELQQINRSRFNPGLVKAFHLHLNQDEVWVVHPLDRLLVGLLDVRKESETEDASMRFVLGGGKSKLLYIPRGVAHGGTVLGHQAVDVVYLVNRQFSEQNPDEWRLPWNILGEDFWQIKKG